MPSIEMKERVTEWFTSADTCFLVGAGCSRCAEKPLIAQLTTDVLTKLDASISKEFEGLAPKGGRPPTIEDLINYLARYQAILASVTDAASHKLEPGWIDDAIKKIKIEIVSAIVDDWKPSAVHARLFSRIGNRRRPLDVFSLNYDTVIEATLDAERFSYVDGFRGSNRAWFDPSTFDAAEGLPSTIRLYKMHGSINWRREADDHVRRVIVRSVADLSDDPVVVYPSEQKYLQTQYGIYEQMLGRFRKRLRANGVNACLVTMGYSFNDDHVNEAIVDAILSPGSNLTVIGFIGPEADLAAQESRIRAIHDRCDQRFNAFIGNTTALGSALAIDEAQALLTEELWRFETLVDFVAGPAA